MENEFYEDPSITDLDDDIEEDEPVKRESYEDFVDEKLRIEKKLKKS